MEDAPDPNVLKLRGYLQVLVRRRAVLAATVLIAASTAVAISGLQPSMYRSSTEVAIEPVRRADATAPESSFLVDTIVETQRRVVNSRRVTERVIDKLALARADPSRLAEQVEVSIVPGTRVVEIAATDRDPIFAARLADAYADAFLQGRRQQALDELAAARDTLQTRVRSLRTQVGAVDAGMGGPAVTDAQSRQSARAGLVEQLAQVEGQLAALQPGAGTVSRGGQVLVPAEAAQTPVSPNPLRAGILGVALGLMFGVGLAYLRDMFGDALRSTDDIREVLGDLPILGRMPHQQELGAAGRPITLVDPDHEVSEGFRVLAATVRFALPVRNVGDIDPGSTSRQQSLVVTSANAEDGKSTVSVNLAVAAAQAGLRVVLVDADLRRPALNERLGVPAGMGMSDLLADPALLVHPDQIFDHLIDVTPGLDLLPSGTTLPPDPTQLLAGPQMIWLHRCLTLVADLVIYDTPPVLPVTDALELAGHADTTLLVVCPARCRRRDLQRSAERLRGVGSKMAGFVVNGWTPDRRRDRRSRPPARPDARASGSEQRPVVAHTDGDVPVGATSETHRARWPSHPRR